MVYGENIVVYHYKTYGKALTLYLRVLKGAL